MAEDTETSSTEKIIPQPSTTEGVGETETAPIEDNAESTITPPIKGAA